MTDHAGRRLFLKVDVQGFEREVLETSQTADAIVRDPPSRIGETLKALKRRFG